MKNGPRSDPGPLLSRFPFGLAHSTNAPVSNLVQI